MELDPSRDKHLCVLSELEAEEPFLLSPTLTFCFCVRRCTWAVQAKTSLSLSPCHALYAQERFQEKHTEYLKEGSSGLSWGGGRQVQVVVFSAP